jgi:uncharacterized phage-associated protein
MATVCDVAAYILEKAGPMTAWKLQKLVYYSQAWSLVWDERPMFGDRIEAWANGPVCPVLYNKHRGQFIVKEVAGDPGALDQTARDTIDAVLMFYGDKHPQWLSDLTHLEAPWRDARGDLPLGAHSSKEIPLDSIAAYYESL